MKRNCAPLCKSCEYLSVEGRCHIDPNAPTAWQPGDLNKMFEKLTQEPYLSKHSVETLSSPATDGPWIITMENVVTEDEAERLIELGAVEGYKRSTDVGKMKADGTTERYIEQRRATRVVSMLIVFFCLIALPSKVSTRRTSSNAWCQHDCYEDPKAQAVISRIANLTGIDEENSEYLQLLKARDFIAICSREPTFLRQTQK